MLQKAESVATGYSLTVLNVTSTLGHVYVCWWHARNTYVEFTFVWYYRLRELKRHRFCRAAWFCKCVHISMPSLYRNSFWVLCCKLFVWSVEKNSLSWFMFVAISSIIRMEFNVNEWFVLDSILGIQFLVVVFGMEVIVIRDFCKNLRVWHLHLH